MQISAFMITIHSITGMEGVPVGGEVLGGREDDLQTHAGSAGWLLDDISPLTPGAAPSLSLHHYVIILLPNVMDKAETEIEPGQDN